MCSIWISKLLPMATGCKWSTLVRVNGGKFRNVGIEAEYGRRLSDRLKWNVSGSYSNPRQKEMNENYWKQAAPKLAIHYRHSL